MVKGTCEKPPPVPSLAHPRQTCPKPFIPGAQQPSGTAHVSLLGSDDSAGLVHVAAAAPAVYGYSRVNN